MKPISRPCNTGQKGEDENDADRNRDATPRGAAEGWRLCRRLVGRDGVDRIGSHPHEELVPIRGRRFIDRLDRIVVDVRDSLDRRDLVGRIVGFTGAPVLVSQLGCANGDLFPRSLNLSRGPHDHSLPRLLRLLESTFGESLPRASNLFRPLIRSLSSLLRLSREPCSRASSLLRRRDQHQLRAQRLDSGHRRRVTTPAAGSRRQPSSREGALPRAARARRSGFRP